MRVERLSLSDWGEALPDAGVEVFHRPGALRALAAHANGDLELYGAFKGHETVAVLPLFVRRGPAGAATVTSPPPGFGVPHLGPVLLPNSPKQRKREKLNRTFTADVLSALDVDPARSLVHVIASTDYTDPRPFDWEGFDLETAFTYRLDLADRTPEDVLGSFSKSLRREVRSGRDLDVTVARETANSSARTVFEETRARYEEQDEPFDLDWPYVRALTANLGDRARVYVARDPAGRFLGGIIVLYSDDAAYFWLGGHRATYEGVSVNSLLHWRIIRDVVDDPPVDSVTSYDLMGANTERLCRYKAKFGARLTPYYVVESKGLQMSLAKRAYELLGRARVAVRGG